MLLSGANNIYIYVFIYVVSMVSNVDFAKSLLILQILVDFAKFLLILQNSCYFAKSTFDEIDITCRLIVF